MTTLPTPTTPVHLYKWSPIPSKTGEHNTKKKTSSYANYKQKLAECYEYLKDPHLTPPMKYKFTRSHNVIYKCNYCEQKIQKYKIFKHIKSHTTVKEKLNHICDNNVCGVHVPYSEKLQKQYSCNMCDKSFEKLLMLHEHSNNHNLDKPYMYKFCSKEYTVSFIVSTHMKCMTFSTGKKLTWYECKICTKIFLELAEIAKHEIHHTKDNNYICSYCQKGFVTDPRLNSHILRVHTGEKIYKCTFCEKRFFAQGDLKSHMRTHTKEKPFKCSQCDKYFGESSHRTAHNRRMYTNHNHGKRSFPCQQCTKSYEWAYKLALHMSTYHGPDKKPFKCQLCPKTFTSKKNLRQHFKSHTKEKPYKCKYCDKTYGCSNSLKIHYRTHTGEKPFKCLKCDKRFAHLSVKVSHLRTHTGEKPYTCKLCKRKLSHPSNLKTHILTHTKELPYKCHLCIKSFLQKGNLKSHLKKIHSYLI